MAHTTGLTTKERVRAICERLNEHYSTDLTCYLTHEDAWQLLVATILSAQCTDARVNIVTRELFKRFPTPETLGNAELSEVEEYVRPTGFYHDKAKHIIACSKEIAERYGGVVPSDIGLLTKLPGVGRKTANVIRGNVFHEPSIVVDTHVKRISRKLGLTKSEDPVQIEKDLMRLLPKEQWILWNIQIIAHGRSICPARKPQCETCFLKDLCKEGKGR
ncbi:MAG: endonuclease III [Lachnospiraceae bacterium]|nr:endonuclease III [Lachnospiraceae bacterium]